MRKINGVWVVREGHGRLQWQHEVTRARPPLLVREWLVGDLWPDTVARAQIRDIIRSRQQLLVVLEQSPQPLELPLEHVPQLPRGVIVQNSTDNILTMMIPELDWLPVRERRRGRRFASAARRTLALSSPLRCPSLLLDKDAASSNTTRFAVAASRGSVSNMLLNAAIDAAFPVRDLQQATSANLDQSPSWAVRERPKNFVERGGAKGGRQHSPERMQARS